MNITLLSSLPHTQDDVEHARLNPWKDYVRTILGAHKRPSEEVWLDHQHILEGKANQLFCTCEQYDVEVVLNAGKSELADAARTANIVIVLAHWKGSKVSCNPPDILASHADLNKPLRTCVERQILSAEKLERNNLNDMHIRRAREKVACWLNDAIDRWDVWSKWLPFDALAGSDLDGAIISTSYGRNLGRALIDEIFGENSLLPGARLELADGLWQPADIAECFPDGWYGVCDFICCTSEYLAEETKCLYPEAIFRADSRLLEPADVFNALNDLIPRLKNELKSADDLITTYMKIAYECDRKHGGELD